MQLAYPPFMEESIRKARRREKLIALLQEVGGPAQAARETGTPKSHFSAITARKRGVGDALAEKLEKAYGKPPGWFDESEESFWPFSDELMKAVMEAGPEDVHSLETAMWAHLRREAPTERHYSPKAEAMLMNDPPPSAFRRPSASARVALKTTKGKT